MYYWYFNLLLALFAFCACSTNTKNEEQVKSFVIDDDIQHVTFYYLDTDSIKPDVCVLIRMFSKDNLGLSFKSLSYNLPSSDNVNDTCATVQISTRNFGEFGKWPCTNDLLHILSLCLRKASESYDISSIKTIDTSVSDFPEIRIEYTRLINNISDNPVNPSNDERIRAVKLTSLSKLLNTILRQYSITIDSMYLTPEVKYMWPPSKKEFLEYYDVDRNIEIPNTLLDAYITLKMKKCAKTYSK